MRPQPATGIPRRKPARIKYPLHLSPLSLSARDQKTGRPKTDVDTLHVQMVNGVYFRSLFGFIFRRKTVYENFFYFVFARAGNDIRNFVTERSVFHAVKERVVCGNQNNVGAEARSLESRILGNRVYGQNSVPELDFEKLCTVISDNHAPKYSRF